MRLEAEAVLGLVQLARLGELTWIGSEVLDLECSRNPDAGRRRKVEALLSVARSKVTAGMRERQRGRELEALGFRAFDALHIACVESTRAEVLLTTAEDPYCQVTGAVSRCSWLGFPRLYRTLTRIGKCQHGRAAG